MKTAKQNDNILRTNKDAVKTYEYLPEDAAVGWMFYLLALLCLAQVGLIGLWINSGLKKKSYTSLVIWSCRAKWRMTMTSYMATPLQFWTYNQQLLFSRAEIAITFAI